MQKSMFSLFFNKILYFTEKKSAAKSGAFWNALYPVA